MTKARLPGVITSSEGLLQKESDLPMVCTSDGFNLDACKLIEESGYDFNKPPSLGHVIDAKPYGVLGEVNEVQSFVASHMKRISTLDVKTNDFES